MDQGTTLLIGDWRVSPALGQISREGQTVRLEARTMRLLMCLADRAGDVVSIDELLDQVWSGVIVTPDSVYQAVAQLRRLLGDDPRQPAYIATVPRLGYRLIATVSSAGDGPPAPMAPTVGGGRRAWPVVAALAALCFALLAGFLLYGKLRSSRDMAATSAVPAQNSVAVLPFLDLTSESMDQEFFADGMTEELIDRLSKIPGLRVAPPTSSFYFKDKKVAVAEIAKSLGVAYILDGSLRKSGSTMRVAARLVRADSGFVVWTETYDRRVDDNLKVQDDIAGEVIKALQPSIAADQGSTALPR
jgi:transcriptional activator of cad operon